MLKLKYLHTLYLFKSKYYVILIYNLYVIYLYFIYLCRIVYGLVFYVRTIRKLIYDL